MTQKWLCLEDKDKPKKYLDSIVCVINIKFNTDIIGQDFNTEDDYPKEIEVQKLIWNLKRLNDDTKKQN